MKKKNGGKSTKYQLCHISKTFWLRTLENHCTTILGKNEAYLSLKTV